MDDNYTLVLVLSISALVGAIAVGIRQMYHCRSGCCESDCQKSMPDRTTVNETTPFLDSENIKNINSIIHSHMDSSRLSPASARKIVIPSTV